MRLQPPRSLAYKLVVAVALLLSMTGTGLAERKKIVLGEITVEGRRQKPQAFYILQRQNLNFDGLELKKSFVPKIEKSVEKQPF
jgi:hypothetical protein